MPLKNELMSGGLPAALANRLGFDTPNTGLTATGSTSQTGSLTMTSNFSVFGTVAANTGALISAKEGFVFNGGVSALLLYPPVGSSINNSSTNASISVPAGKGAMYWSAGLIYAVIVSA